MRIKMKKGDRIHNGSFKGVVIDADQECVWLAWDCASGIDLVRRSSPLLLVVTVEKEIK